MTLLSVAAPVSSAHALTPAARDAIEVAASAERAALELLEKACEDCIDTDADGAIVDDAIAAEEMHATTADEEDAAAEVVDWAALLDDFCPLDGTSAPLHRRYRAHSLRGSVAVAPSPVLGPVLVVSRACTHVLPRISRPCDDARCRAPDPRATHLTVARAVTWLRQRRSVPPSSDAAAHV